MRQVLPPNSSLRSKRNWPHTNSAHEIQLVSHACCFTAVQLVCVQIFSPGAAPCNRRCALLSAPFFSGHSPGIGNSQEGHPDHRSSWGHSMREERAQSCLSRDYTCFIHGKFPQREKYQALLFKKTGLRTCLGYSSRFESPG